MNSPKSRLAIVADDHELFRAGLSQMLRQDFGFSHVFEACSLDGIVGYLDEAPDTSLISLDLTMPGMKGASSVQEIRRAHPHLCITVITASERREEILQLLQAGVHGFIPKTLGISEIKRAIQHVLTGQIYVPPILSVAAPESPTTIGFEEFPRSGAARMDLKLSPRQLEVLILIAKGRSNKEIARELRLSEGTVKVHVNALFRALGVHNRVTAVSLLAQISRPPKIAPNALEIQS